jgi:uroporphyrin-III C-methyltransferase
MTAAPIEAGTVYLVGAGPGDPELLTLRAARLLGAAELVVHDALVSPEILDMAHADAELVDVGKRHGGRHTCQDRINRMLADAASEGRVVVRLKGGDPLVFGRGGEEALFLRARGVRFELVPGITTALGVSAYAGMPLTHRGLSSCVTLVTGHEFPDGGSAVDWEALARTGGTLVVYMAMGRLAKIAERLIRAGRAPGTPAAVVESATRHEQRVKCGTLATVGVEARGSSAPGVLLVGEVARLRDELAWFEGGRREAWERGSGPGQFADATG